MVHSVQTENPDFSEKSDALPYALCAMRFAVRNFNDRNKIVSVFSNKL